MKHILLIKNIGQLATPCGYSAKCGKEQNSILFLEDAWILAEDGIIMNVGTKDSVPDEDELAKEYSKLTVINAEGRLATPGLVDAHTHLVFGGWRQNELAMKLNGASYLDILQAGGGIHSTVLATRKASQKELENKAKLALKEMLSFGTTTCEAKSGYGLNVEDELRQLRIVNTLNEKQPIELVSTFLGAHAIPKEYAEDRKAYVDLICNEIIPLVAKEKLAEFCDVFCEKGAFTAKESKRILLAGIAAGMRAKIHADEIESIGGTELCGEIGAISAEHLIVCKPSGINSMKKSGTIACCLPCTSFYLTTAYAPARDIIDAGVAVAMATDFNPGSCPNLNMQLVMNIGCLRYGLTPSEALTAVTLNGAAALGRAEHIGSLEPGKQADIIIWDAPDLNYIFYRIGSNLCRSVIKKGELVYG